MNDAARVKAAEERRFTEQWIADTLRALGDDELAVVAAVIDGLAKGRQLYGELDLATDGRDFRAEAGEELRDATIYLTAALVKRRRAGR